MDRRQNPLLILVAETQLYERLCPSVSWSVHNAQVQKSKNACLRCYCECVWGVGGGGVVRLCPLVRTLLVTRKARLCNVCSKK